MTQALGITLVAALLACCVIGAMKGHPWGFIGLLIPVVLLIAPFWALSLAKPNTWWARKFYGPEKFAKAAQRYPGDLPRAAPPSWQPDPLGAGRLLVGRPALD